MPLTTETTGPCKLHLKNSPSINMTSDWSQSGRAMLSEFSGCAQRAESCSQDYTSVCEQDVNPLCFTSQSFCNPSSPQFDPRSPGAPGGISWCELGGLYIWGDTWNSCIQVRLELQPPPPCGVKSHSIHFIEQEIHTTPSVCCWSWLMISFIYKDSSCRRWMSDFTLLVCRLNWFQNLYSCTTNFTLTYNSDQTAAHTKPFCSPALTVWAK